MCTIGRRLRCPCRGWAYARLFAVFGLLCRSRSYRREQEGLSTLLHARIAALLVQKESKRLVARALSFVEVHF